MTPETYFFGYFLLRLSGNKCSQVLSIGKFGPTAPDFGNDFPMYFLLYIVYVWVCWLLLSPYGGSNNPCPLKCFCASPHQIFAKSASQNARNRDKADFKTKVRKLRIN